MTNSQSAVDKSQPEKSDPYKVLIVDDSKSILNALTNDFAKTNYEVKTFTNPVKAYQAIEDEHFHIVVSDIEMPQMSGLDLLRKIKNHNGMIQVIIMTSFITVNNTLNTFRYGASDMIFKPFNPPEVLEAVDEAAAKLDRVNLLLAKAMKMKGS